MDAIIVCDLLEDDFDVVHVERLDAALERLNGWRPRCALVDMSLPDMHGPAIIAAVREAAPEVPVIALSGFDDRDAAASACAAGARDYVVKGIEAEPLLSAISAALA